MRRSEITQLLNDFKEAYQRLSALTLNAASEEADFEREKATFDSLFARISESRALLDDEQREYVQRVSSLPFRHRVRVAFNRSRTRSLSRSRETSISEVNVNSSSNSLPSDSSNSLPSESSFTSSSSRAIMDPSAEQSVNKGTKEGVKDISGGNPTKRKSLLQLQLDAEEEFEKLEREERRRKKGKKEGRNWEVFAYM